MTFDPKSKISRLIRRLLRLKKKPMASDEFFRKWKKAREELYKTPEYQNFLREVRLRAMFLCQRGCGKKGRHVHHKIRVYDNPRLVVDPANAEFLCVACHNKEHKDQNAKRRTKLAPRAEVSGAAKPRPPHRSAAQTVP